MLSLLSKLVAWHLFHPPVHPILEWVVEEVAAVVAAAVEAAVAVVDGDSE